LSSDPGDVLAYIDSALKALNVAGDPNYDPVVGYAIAFQLLPKAQDLAPDLVESLQKAGSLLEAQIGGSAARIRGRLGSPQPPDPKGGESARRRDRLIGDVLSRIGSGRFGEAREELKNVDDITARAQVGALIDFAESADAIGRKDLQWA